MQHLDKFQAVVTLNGSVAFYEHCSGVPRVWGKADDHLSDLEVMQGLLRAAECTPIPQCLINISLASTLGYRGQRLLHMIRDLQGGERGVIGLEITEHGVHLGHTADVGRFIRLARDQGLAVALDGVESDHPFSHHSFAWRAGITHVKIRASEEDFAQLAGDFRDRGIKVIAKHVEHRDQLMRARQSADYLQGFLIARPRPLPVSERAQPDPAAGKIVPMPGQDATT
jgi:EAL domain-containing protein (putative c-di-GMP-specific phosphodiesterase class I)